jgi:site-specific DNA-methyltransferase (cytosine-N4-specific)
MLEFEMSITLNKTMLNYSSAIMLEIVKERINYIEDNNYYQTPNIEDWYSEWDFKQYNPNIYSHGFHQYPAKFIPQLARKLLRIFTDQNSVILDIFSGSGTTLIESFLLHRRKAIGIELNPFAIFMARVKTKPINPGRLKESFLEIRSDYNNPKFDLNNLDKFHNINFWFKDDTIVELSILKKCIINIDSIDHQNFFLLILSDVIRKVSLTKHSGFKLHRDKMKLSSSFKPNVFLEFEKVFNKNIQLMNDFYDESKDSQTEVLLIHGDSREKQNIEEASVDFILTSPPYGDSRTTVAYGQFSRLSWQWIKNDSNIYSLDNDLLGGKNNVSFNNEILDFSSTLKQQLEVIKNENLLRAKDVLSFYIDLFETLKNAYFYLKKDKYFVLVTGNRTVKNVFLRTDIIISEFAKIIGFTVEKVLFRNIINKRMPEKNCPTNIKGQYSNTMLQENIIFLRKK